MTTTKMLFIGDVIGNPGRGALRTALPGIVKDLSPHLVVINGENSAGGFGITPDVYKELMDMGVDVITSGNHVWDKKEIVGAMDVCPALIRPANYPEGAPGRGHGVFKARDGAKVGVINLCGRVFMESLECPFRTAERLVTELKKETPLIIIDMHAEATSEKAAIAFYLDGKVGAVIGTHTHVQTSDERILSGGTAFITDAGLTGSMDSVIGMEKEGVITRFLTEMPVKFAAARGSLEVQGAVVELDSTTGMAVSIKRVKEKI